MVLVQINFDFPVEMMGDNLTREADALARSINHEPGFISKIWIENSHTGESGGIYLFKDMESAQQYAEMHAGRIREMGARNIKTKFFYVNKPLSQLNHGI